MILKSAMFLTIMRNLLSALAMLGLILAPLARPAMAAAAEMHVVMSDQTAGMPADMSCCPDAAPIPDCAKDCPLMALCMVGSVLTLPTNVVPFVPRSVANLALAGNDADVAGLTYGPPPRPPKI